MRLIHTSASMNFSQLCCPTTVKNSTTITLTATVHSSLMPELNSCSVYRSTSSLFSFHFL